MAVKDSNQFLDEEHLLPEDEKDDSGSLPPRPRRSSWTRLFPYSASLNIILSCLLASTWVYSIKTSRKTYILNEIYSPAQPAVEYKTVVFTGGLHGDKSEYQGSSEDVNKKWEALYNDIGMSQISAESAARLPNATTPLSGDPSQYMVELDVFHQLHCLNLMRKLVYPEVFKLDLTSGSAEAEDNVYHMEHCYDQLRQSIQCASDVSTIYWEWSREKKKMFGNLKTTHTCKDFEKIKEWAMQHRLHEDFDWFKEVEGAPIRHSH
ncbi:hypothetical protein QQS21_012431 [Conoideocrella luteorostrata]|uniref:Uncharacterized protein n=1 Tax=Conoideocrella luteorostrata TaxID=1105319 RepID=A0AAJ0CBH5_9HYPO|nr:hypothetical protein QQS21_012431 [Conoideocrella luteorostrata]